MSICTYVILFIFAKIVYKPCTGTQYIRLPVVRQVVAANDEEVPPPEQAPRHYELLLLGLVTKQLPLPTTICKYTSDAVPGYLLLMYLKIGKSERKNFRLHNFTYTSYCTVYNLVISL